jgi:hypothetical protein
MLYKQIPYRVHRHELQRAHALGGEDPQQHLQPMLGILRLCGPPADVSFGPTAAAVCSTAEHCVAPCCNLMGMLLVADDIPLGRQSARSSASRANDNAAPTQEAALRAPLEAAGRPAPDKRSWSAGQPISARRQNWEKGILLLSFHWPPTRRGKPKHECHSLEYPSV